MAAVAAVAVEGATKNSEQYSEKIVDAHKFH